MGTVDVQNTPDFALYMDRKDNFGIAGAVAGDMSGEPVNVIHQLHSVFCHGGAFRGGPLEAGGMFVKR